MLGYAMKLTSTATSLMVLVASLCLIAVACGSDGDGAGDGEFMQITPHDTTFTRADIEATGYKVQREYDLDGLEGATAAYYGFWRIPDGDPIDFEVRLYPSHADAVELGVSLADEGSGTDAALDAEDAVYKEGIRDRRMVVGLGPGGGGRSGRGPRYGDYAVYGNVVLLCQGAAVVQALERCRQFAEAIDAAAQK